MDFSAMSIKFNLTLETCSCTIFWDDIPIIWNENIVCFLNEKKKLFWTNKKFVYLIFINVMISSKNNVQKYRSKGHEQVFSYLEVVVVEEVVEVVQVSQLEMQH